MRLIAHWRGVAGVQPKHLCVASNELCAESCLPNGGCNNSCLSTFSPCMVIEGATSAMVLPFSFIYYILWYSFVSTFPVSVLIL